MLYKGPVATALPPLFIRLTMNAAERFLRAIAPEDLEGFGCYVVSSSEIQQQYPSLNREGVLAYTSLHLANALRPWLESVGRWVGDGFATIVYRDQIPTWPEVLGVVVHEFAHWLTSDPIPEQMPDDALAVVAEYAASDSTTTLAPPWAGHGPEFQRAACHLAVRAEKVLESVRPSLLRFSKPYTGISEPTIVSLLRDEVDSYSGPIRDLIKQPEPKQFAELWDSLEGFEE